jgi:hypothetical protein
MSKNQLAHSISVELRKLNEVIDMKIIRGLSYRAEARRHKHLLTKLNQANRQRSFFSGLSFASFL